MLTPRIPLVVGRIGDRAIHLLYGLGVLKRRSHFPLSLFVSSVRIGVFFFPRRDLACITFVFWGNVESSFIGHWGSVPKLVAQ